MGATVVGRPQPDEQRPPATTGEIALRAGQFLLGAAATALLGSGSLPVLIGVVALAALAVGVLIVRGRRGTFVLSLRARRWMVVVSVASLALSLAAAFRLGITHGGATSDRRAGRVLLNLVTPDLRPSCRIVGSGDASSVTARLRCRDAAAAVDFEIRQLASRTALTREIDARGRGLPAGQCFTQVAAAGEYDVGGSRQGALLCSEQGETSRITWSNERLLVLAEAEQERGAGQSLIQWWSDHQTAISAAGLRRAFPDEFERRLLAHVPSPIRSSCRRDGYSLSGSVATVRCRARGGVIDVYYLAFSRAADMRQHSDAAAAGWRHAKGSCSIHSQQPAVARYGDGVRVCHDQRDTSWIEWSDEPTLVYAYARRTRRSVLTLSALYHWWRSSAGPS